MFGTNINSTPSLFEKLLWFETLEDKNERCVIIVCVRVLYLKAIIFRDSLEWIHVICAWWVPEVKIEDVRYIERITKDKIPVSTCKIYYLL